MLSAVHAQRDSFMSFQICITSFLLLYNLISSVEGRKRYSEECFVFFVHAVKVNGVQCWFKCHWLLVHGQSHSLACLLCFTEEIKSQRFVNDDRTMVFGWSFPLRAAWCRLFFSVTNTQTWRPNAVMLFRATQHLRKSEWRGACDVIVPGALRGSVCVIVHACNQILLEWCQLLLPVSIQCSRFGLNWVLRRGVWETAGWGRGQANSAAIKMSSNSA